MFSLSSMYGLGVILSAKNQISPMARQAEASLKSLKNSSKNQTEAMMRQFDKLSDSLVSFKSNLKSGLKMMAAGAIVLGGLGLLGGISAQAEDSMGNVRSLLVGTGLASQLATIQITGLQNQIINMADKTRIPMMNLEKSSYDLVSANLTVAQTMGILPATAKLAVAGMGSMTQATDFMASSMNTFGKTWGNSMTAVEKGNKIANTAAAVIAQLKTNLPNLSSAMAFAAGDANVLGASIAETATLVGMLQTKGIQGARAGTSLAAMFRELVNLDKKGKAAGPLQGLNLEDAEGSLRPIASIIQDIENRLKGLGSVEQGRILGAAFGDEGKRAIQLLIGQSDALRELVGNVERSNALDKMVEARQSTLLGQWAMMKNGIRAVAISLGAAFLPMMKSAIHAFKSMAKGILNFATAHPVLTRIMLAISFLFGVSLLLAGGIKIMTGAFLVYKNLMPIITGLTTIATGGFGALAASIWATMWPILAVIGGLTALLYVIDLIAGTNMVGGIWDFFKGVTAVSTPDLSGFNNPMQLAMPGVSLSPDISSDGDSSGNNNAQVTNNYGRTVHNYNLPGVSNSNEFMKTTEKNLKRTDSRKSEGTL